MVRYAGILDPAPVEDETLQAPITQERRGLADDELFIEKVSLYTNKNAWYPRNLTDDHARYRVRFASSNFSHSRMRRAIPASWPDSVGS